MENHSNCHVSVQSTPKLASAWAHQLPALGTGMREGAWSIPPFLKAGSKMCRAGILPRAAPSWASLLLPVPGGRKYQANSSVHDFKTSTSSAGCEMRMEQPG